MRSKADEDKDDYLNANFVDGFRQPRAYIATQGPIQGTFPAFWKMVWEQNTQVIVMITHLFENGKVCPIFTQWIFDEKSDFGYFDFFLKVLLRLLWIEF